MSFLSGEKRAVPQVLHMKLLVLIIIAVLYSSCSDATKEETLLLSDLRMDYGHRYSWTYINVYDRNGKFLYQSWQDQETGEIFKDYGEYEGYNTNKQHEP